jgi:hypothetical protein
MYQVQLQGEYVASSPKSYEASYKKVTWTLRYSSKCDVFTKQDM